VVRNELSAAYGWAGQSHREVAQVERTAGYLFEGVPLSTLRDSERGELARFALEKRQGLPPARGLVTRPATPRGATGLNLKHT
jgi:hypothetical protein